MREAALVTADVRDPLLDRVRTLTADRLHPLLVALDGRSGSGKSTLATAVATALGATVISGDDFYSGGTAAAWDQMSPAQRADHCIDWRRQRPVLDALAAGEDAYWFAYDWEAFDGSFASTPSRARSAPVVLLEGVYSARPELADLIDLRVLLAVPDGVRRSRLLDREGEHFDPAWDARWSSAEEHYFTSVMASEVFDLVLTPGR